MGSQLAGSEWRNCIIVFIGRQQNALCSSGGNETRAVHREPTGLDGTADGNKAWRTAERRKRPCVQPTTVETGSCLSGGVWRTAKRRKRTSYGRNGVLLIGRGVGYRKRRKRTCVAALQSKWGSCSSGGVWRTAKRDSMGYCSSPPSTSSSLHGLLFIHRRPPPASTCDCSSTGSCSSSLHRAFLHRLMFNQPSPRGSCSTTPP